MAVNPRSSASETTPTPCVTTQPTARFRTALIVNLKVSESQKTISKQCPNLSQPMGRLHLRRQRQKSSKITVASRLARDIAEPMRRPESEEDDHTALRRIRTLTNQRFERFIVVFLASLGMTDIKVINRLRPGELDIHASMSVASVMDVHFSVQALNWRRDVHGGDVQLLRGGMRIGDHGLIIATSEFQRGAIEEATRKDAIPIATINGTELVKIAKERGAVRVLGLRAELSASPSTYAGFREVFPSNQMRLNTPAQNHPYADPRRPCKFRAMCDECRVLHLPRWCMAVANRIRNPLRPAAPASRRRSELRT